MEPPKKNLYPALLLVWLGAFAFETAGLAHWWTALRSAEDRLEDQAAGLEDSAARIQAMARGAQRDIGEEKYLEQLPNLLPKDKGYARTERAIAEEVRALQRKLAPRIKDSLQIIVDAKANKLYLKKGFKLLWEADCSVGRGRRLYDRKTGQRWHFVTPRGEFHVLSKAVNPLWRKPDWAYVEEGKPVPPPNDPARLVKGELGAYLLNLGDGYLIHGTKDEKVLGRPASHGCVRLGADDLKKLYQTAPVGTKVFIFY